jgi:uncharacterized membrane protein
MADLIVIGYDDEETADLAAEEVMRLSDDLVIQPESVAVIRRDLDGRYHVETTHHPVLEGATWGMLWGVLFGLLFFIPGFGLAVGAGLGALFGLLNKAGIDQEFQQRVRDMVQPGTSALFMIVDKITPDKAIEALSRYGGTVLQTSLSKEVEEELQQALHGSPKERAEAAQSAPAGVA